MTLSQAANIADLIAALGVIGSLLFLAFELRLSNKETRMSNWRQLLDSFRDYKAITNDVSFSDLIERGNTSYDGLTAAEKRSYGQYLEQGIHVIGNFSKHRGGIPVELSGLQAAVGNSLLDLLNNRGAQQWYAEYKPKGKLMPETFRNIDEMLAKVDRDDV